MQFKLTALIDDETRLQLRELLLGMVKGITRELLTETIQNEIRLKLDGAMKDLSKSDWIWKRNIFQVVREVVHEEVKSKYPVIGEMIDKAALNAVDAAVFKKLEDKTIWEAGQQKDFIRTIVKEEMVTAFRATFGGK